MQYLAIIRTGACTADFMHHHCYDNGKWIWHVKLVISRASPWNYLYYNFAPYDTIQTLKHDHSSMFHTRRFLLVAISDYSHSTGYRIGYTTPKQNSKRQHVIKKLVLLWKGYFQEFPNTRRPVDAVSSCERASWTYSYSAHQGCITMCAGFVLNWNAVLFQFDYWVIKLIEKCIKLLLNPDWIRLVCSVTFW